ncbi:nitric oxide synthase oxygenase [Nocardia terpenica]|uniref:nitric oxide synthase oxygenase n=1 Tax=Nocardia terpenica TaxID=455432 RepID=UPI001EEB270C|nr:nitric oxide synthase oxygenase [Nocardia terpenica]
MRDELIRELVRRRRECARFFALPQLAHVGRHRVREALAELDDTGIVTHTSEELVIGARLAWRNSPRCLGRAHWRALHIADARLADTPGGLAQACWAYLQAATNGGAVRVIALIGPPRRLDGIGLQIVNPQLIGYGGYLDATNATVVGDPASIALTAVAQDLGWDATGGRFDLLPLVISDPDGDLSFYPAPEQQVLEVPMAHPDPELRWFTDLGLKWHALHSVSNMTLEIGGMSYPTVFNEWYVSSQIAAMLARRDGVLVTIAERMGLDTSSERTLWRDRALLEINRAVLHSYHDAGVRIVDHHTAARLAVGINPPRCAQPSTTPCRRCLTTPDPALRPAFVSSTSAAATADIAQAVPPRRRQASQPA